MLLWPFNKYPGTDYETFNWEWLIGIGKKMEQALHDLYSNVGALHQMVDTVLREHPEWVTTVMDGAITAPKINELFLKAIKNVYATPEEFGAVGDGVTDDTAAVVAALADGRAVFLDKIYAISEPIEIGSYTTILGNSPAYSTTGKSGLKALSNFTGNYLVNTSAGTNRSISLNRFSLLCENVTGGFYGTGMYDACDMDNINITDVDGDSYGINIEYNGFVNQGITFNNVVAQSENRVDPDKPVINLERCQECTFNNVRAFAPLGKGIKTSGSKGCTFTECAGIDLAAGPDSTGIEIDNYVNMTTGNTAPASYLSLINCASEGSRNGLVCNVPVQTVTGSFTQYSTGDTITQNGNRAVIRSGSATQMQIYPIDDLFTTGDCSNGSITGITSYGENSGFNVMNFRAQVAASGRQQRQKILGAVSSVFTFARTIGSGTQVYEIDHCPNTKIKYSQYQAPTVISDNSAEIETSASVITTVSAPGAVAVTARNIEGNRWVVISDGTSYSNTMNPSPNMFGEAVVASWFTRIEWVYRNDMWFLVSCDGGLTGNTSKKVLRYPSKNIEDITAGTTANSFKTDNLIMNNGATQQVSFGIPASCGNIKGWKCQVAAVNYNIAVTTPDGTENITPGTSAIYTGVGNGKIIKL